MYAVTHQAGNLWQPIEKREGWCVTEIETGQQQSVPTTKETALRWAQQLNHGQKAECVGS